MRDAIDSPAPSRPFSAWERRTRAWAVAFAGLTLACSCGLALLVFQTGDHPLATAGVLMVLTLGMYQWHSRAIRRRRAILRLDFPPEWEAVLNSDVRFYQSLDPAAQARFRTELKVFLHEKRITGIKTEVDTTTRVLTAASAIIPIFGFPEWEWDQIGEVLIYPTRFNRSFEHGDGKDHAILGMVGTGFMNRIMILAKPDLIDGFRRPTDSRNVGLHEFAHLVDKADGVIDGVPTLGLGQQAIGPWMELVRKKMAEIESGRSNINRYALTNEAEFFAVVSEYFFERPESLHQEHPELYAALQQAFNQDTRGLLSGFRQVFSRSPRKISRNAPCPCGSGLKFKKCCLGASAGA
jgi:Mlc titration factor MtfA (ptsG expression regulator)